MQISFPRGKICIVELLGRFSMSGSVSENGGVIPVFLVQGRVGR